MNIQAKVQGTGDTMTARQGYKKITSQKHTGYMTNFCPQDNEQMSDFYFDSPQSITTLPGLHVLKKTQTRVAETYSEGQIAQERQIQAQEQKLNPICSYLPRSLTL